MHAVSSDAHDNARRPPRLRDGFEALEADLPGLSEQCDWYTEAAPAAILAGEPLPERPKPAKGRGRFRRLFSRSAA